MARYAGAGEHRGCRPAACNFAAGNSRRTVKSPHKSLRCGCRICTTGTVVSGSAPSWVTRPDISYRAQGAAVYRRSWSVSGPPHDAALARYWPKGAGNGARRCIRCERKPSWARQGLNLRPHPCEGNWRSRVTTLVLRDKIKPRNCLCKRFVRRPLAYRLVVSASTSLDGNIAQAARQVLAKYGGPGGRRWLPPDQQETAGRAATLRSSSKNSCAVVGESYRCGDSRASAVLVGWSL